jgi:hypothetical protein
VRVNSGNACSDPTSWAHGSSKILIQGLEGKGRDDYYNFAGFEELNRMGRLWRSVHGSKAIARGSIG